MRVCMKRDVHEALRFVYTGDIDGPEATKRARELGLTTNGGVSKLWEIETTAGWKIVSHGDLILYRDNRAVGVTRADEVTVIED